MPGKWRQAPAELTRRFAALLPAHPDVQPRKMFGYACAFVRGNFWTGLFEDKVVVRLPDGLHQHFPTLAGAPPFDPMGGRPMKGWYVVPAAVVADDSALARFLRETFAAVLQLPAKTAAKKTATKKTAKKKTAKKKTAKKQTAKKKTAKKWR